MSNDALLDRLRKVRALAQHGEGGERAAAAEALARLLAANGLAEADLDPPAEVAVWRPYAWANADEHTILIQIICHILKSREFSVRTSPRKRSFEVALTASQAATVEVLYAVCVRQWRIERKRLLNAFIVRHRLLSGQPADDDSAPPDPDEIAAIKAFMNGMAPINAHPALAAPKR